jgi:hypothetical protein
MGKGLVGCCLGAVASAGSVGVAGVLEAGGWVTLGGDAAASVATGIGAGTVRAPPPRCHHKAAAAPSTSKPAGSSQRHTRPARVGVLAACRG